MRNRLIGILGIAIAGLLVGFAVMLPRGEEIEKLVAPVSRFSQTSATQVRSLRDQLDEFRQSEWRELGERIGQQTGKLTEMLRKQSIDYDAIQALEQGLGGVSRSLGEWTQSLDTTQLTQLADAFRKTADYLEQNLGESGPKTAAALEKLADAFEIDAKRLSAFLTQSPPDLKAAREVYDALGRFESGLDAVETAVKFERFGEMREGLRGMESALGKTAEQVERIGRFSYPVVKFQGLKPDVQQQPFFPAAGEIAEGMNKSAKGINAAGEEMDKFATALPKLRDSLSASRAILGRTRETLGKALSQESAIESTLQRLPKQTAQISEQLPKIAREFASMLRKTEQFQKSAQSLRKTGDSLQTIADRWPTIREQIGQSAKALTVIRGQLQKLLNQRDTTDQNLQEVREIVGRFATLTPLAQQQFDARLSTQIESMEQFEALFTDVDREIAKTVNVLQRISWVATGLLVAMAGLTLTQSIGILRRDRPSD
ncbi:coiled-coil domain-containing protein [Tuwongella immobilis]|nr:hypothetical protein [Tuwongella immobilis]